jgi:hypothetical protein
MIIDDTGLALIVAGKSIDIAPIGPIPGRTPISVPRKTPMKQARRFSGVKITEKPKKMR